MSKRLKAFVLTLVAAAGVIFAPQAALAGGGGCADDPGWNGWRIGACLSASGSVLHPDYYVNAKGASPTGCNVKSYYVRGSSWTELNSRRCDSTPTGHFGPFSRAVPFGPNICYVHAVVVGPINGASRIIYSPAWCS